MEPQTAKRMVSLKIETTRNTTVLDPISTHLTASGEKLKIGTVRAVTSARFFALISI